MALSWGTGMIWLDLVVWVTMVADPWLLVMSTSELRINCCVIYCDFILYWIQLSYSAWYCVCVVVFTVRKHVYNSVCPALKDFADGRQAV